MTKAQAVIIENTDWQAALDDSLSQLAGFGPPDLLFVFASDRYGANLPELISSLYRQSGARVLLGCTGQGIIGQEREIEGKTALSLLALSLPQAYLQPVHLTGEEVAAPGFRLSLPEAKAWLLLADPFTFGAGADQMLTYFGENYPAMPLIGGMASGDFRLRRTMLFLNDQILNEGALALAVGGDYTLRPVVSQGATPIGEAWMVTAAQQNIIASISGRPAYEVLADTIKGLSPILQQKVRRNLLVGLAVDEYKADFERGDFIIRNLMAIDPQSGAIAISDEARVGQTIQFQLRDGEAADEDLRELLIAFKKAEGSPQPLAGVLFSCNGRGVGLFGSPDHDAQAIQAGLGQLPLAGFFCNGEIGPIGRQNFIHGFTASLGLFVKSTVEQAAN